jgi:hypothetical protein
MIAIGGMVPARENQSARENPAHCKFFHKKFHTDWRTIEPDHLHSGFFNLLSGQQLHNNSVQRIRSEAKELDVFQRNRIIDNTDTKMIRMTHTHTNYGTQCDTKQEYMARLCLLYNRAKSRSILMRLPI